MPRPRKKFSRNGETILVLAGGYAADIPSPKEFALTEPGASVSLMITTNCLMRTAGTDSNTLSRADARKQGLA